MYTVNSEIFVRVYLCETSHMLSFVKKILKKCWNHSVVYEYNCHCSDISSLHICTLTLFAKIKLSQKILDLQYTKNLTYASASLLPLYLQMMQLKFGRDHSPLGIHCTSGVPVGSCLGAHLYFITDPTVLIFGGIGIPSVTGGSISHPK